MNVRHLGTIQKYQDAYDKLISRVDFPEDQQHNNPYLKRQLSQKKFEDRRARDMCFYCDEKYVPGHKCKGQVFSLEVVVYPNDVLLETEQVRVCGHAGKYKLHILIDRDNTHNFLDLNTAMKLGCNLKGTCPIHVDVGGGNQLGTKIKTQVAKLFSMALIAYQSTYLITLNVSKEVGDANLCKTLAPRHQTLSTYEKELSAVIQALEKWKGHMFDKHFQIKTNHFSLKYLLVLRISTPSQMKWLAKLMGFDYEILYKKRRENKVADAFSRVDTSAQLMQMLITVTRDFV
ncbi:hypothetical protein CTI12_AA397460 [Artemisia annua]|uniref:Reverse transcriptase RNase H-like domain-containing protein n=1 Tax=Artemisia annua TaxID=35608 RepID=A0A2U1LZE1_ARTAN|nr:hypothetical protein CTI12_AA397460 [Artemisia annua]